MVFEVDGPVPLIGFGYCAQHDAIFSTRYDEDDFVHSGDVVVRNTMRFAEFRRAGAVVDETNEGAAQRIHMFARKFARAETRTVDDRASPPPRDAPFSSRGLRTRAECFGVPDRRKSKNGCARQPLRRLLHWA
jgi:hypothetical protein